jgi:hypothetical protein
VRSCPTIQAFLESSALRAGATLRARVVLVSTTETPVSAITLSLVGKERRYRRTRSSGSTSTKVYHRRTIVNLVASYPARTLVPGRLELVIDFHLPADAPPSYRSQFSAIEYALMVHVDIPWWFDAHAEFPVTVLAVPTAVTAGGPKPARFENTYGPQGRKLYIECALGRAIVESGGTVEAVCSLSNLAFNRVAEVDVDLVVVETAQVESTAGPAVTWSQPGQVLLPTSDGESLPIRFGVSPSLPPTFTTPFIQVEHFLRLRAKIRFGFDEELLVPIVVTPEATGPSLAAAPAAVGSAKQAAVWAAAVERATSLGARVVRIDPEHGELALEVDGVPVLISRRRGKDDKPTLAGSIDYPDLGLGLQLATRAWSDMGRGLSLPGEAARKLFADVRDPDQVSGFLDGAVVDWLLLFDRVAMSDAEALVSDPGSPHKRRDVTYFVERVVQGTRTLLGARARILPPRGFSGHDVATYQAFAVARGGDLRVGDMSVRGEIASGLVFELTHELAATGPVRSLWSFRAPGHDLSSASLPPAIAARVIEGAVSVAAPVPRDPAGALEALGPLREALLRCLGRELGPYR